LEVEEGTFLEPKNQGGGTLKMTRDEKLIQRKMSLLELAEVLANVSQACRIGGVSRQHFYDIKTAYEQGGMIALKEKSRRKSNIGNRVHPDVEAACLEMADAHPAYGMTRVAHELRTQGLMVSPGGVRCVWLRHNLETFRKRLQRLEEKAARDGILLTQEQIEVLEELRCEREEVIETIETHHPGYLVGQDTFYVGYLKGVGRIYQQTAIDTYSRVGFAKLYTMKMPVAAADLLNDRVLPFFEKHGVPVLRILTDRGGEFCGLLDQHPYELFLGLHQIDHTRTRACSPQTNGITERFHQTMLFEFYMVQFRKKVYRSLEELQADLDVWLVEYNHRRPHQGKRCDGKTPMQTFLGAMTLVQEKLLPCPPDAA
jgi:transposase InsO family protein